MSAFLLTIFWLQVFGVLCGITHMAGAYPRIRGNVSLGVDTVALIINLSLLAWASYLLWGQQ